MELCGRLVEDAKAYVIDDGLNYDSHVEARQLGPGKYPARFFRLIDGTLVDFPWSYQTELTEENQAHTRTDTRSKDMLAIPPAFRSDGWYLVGQNINEYDRAEYIALLYYNEETSRLRVYLYNMFGAQKLVTFYKVRLSLLSRKQGAQDGLGEARGAFFPLDPSPRNWHEFDYLHSVLAQPDLGVYRGAVSLPDE